MADLDEGIKAANEVLVVLSAANLISTFKDVQSLYEKEDIIRRKNLKDAKEIIQNLQEDHASVEEKALKLGPESFSQEMFQENMDLKRIEDAKLKEQVQNLESEEKIVEAQLSETSNKFENLNEKKKRLEEERTRIVPEGKSFFDLYLQTTGIHWDYNCPEDQIRGFVSGKKDIKPFSLNPGEHSNFYNVNYLWDLIDATHTD